MAEPVQQWWARRQFSRGSAVPYEVGTFRSAWAAYPELIRQYHPELNHGVVLSQVPLAADVLLCWECTVGHRFAATPTEQRERPGRVRRRSAWCPECSALARPQPVILGEARAIPRAPRRRAPELCTKTPDLASGTPFLSACAPKPASAAEAALRAGLSERLLFDREVNAVKVSRPFFRHTEVWPDIVIPELRIAVEYDTVGRHGLEHVGKRQDADQRKDRALRAAGWEVVRIRTGALEPIGPFDLRMSSVGVRGITRLLETFRGIRGDLLVDAYLR
ncbi:zinc-ribbon domain-containing protein [Microbacterium hydrocarbonoxydans]|uniref:zinc-ribbon domain-containing protein n=1 Tax=Microbacterium hydrocarbonoxydans TaxID=273678 RepID=UPI00203F957D|nr:zinc-ribbon domain-containing protein [Microbacterium hydrocarbonoxydans]MCM3778675.1 endonuclease domain-containing protein [Microbacterium hydrocarbonoxydans]